jgi:predicted site-specific integrase-resolvase
MKRSGWAPQNGITSKTAWKGWKAGKLPVPAGPTGTILVDAAAREEVGAGLYARASSEKADLDRQVSRLAALAAENGLLIAEAGSGLHGHRKGLLAVLRSPDDSVIVVEHRDAKPRVPRRREFPGDP